MSRDSERLRELLARYIERVVGGGSEPSVEGLCGEETELIEPLSALIVRYRQLSETLARPSALSEVSDAAAGGGDAAVEALPAFSGFRTIERLGGGGGGQVYKLEDLELGRQVAAKVLSQDAALHASVEDFLREARALALFEDPRIVRLFELRRQPDPPVLIMELVEGFALGKLGPSLEYAQRARLVAEIADAIDHAHRLGIQHRDLKPSNILVDATLTPRILDFGLSQGDPRRGHFRGTLAYMAPEQLDSSRAIDARTDVYAIGVLLYELLCGTLPYRGDSQEELIGAIRGADPSLPVEIEPTVPEPLQAIALKAMERDPSARYETARELALELRRYLDDRPVLARPTLYQSALTRRIRPHLQQVLEWLRLKLIYRHEADQLARAYRRLEARDDDWIVQSRALTPSKIALYLGSFVLSLGALFYFAAYQAETIGGLGQPLLVLGLPCVALNAAALGLYRRDQRAVAIAFFFGAVLLLPLLLLIVFQELDVLSATPGSEHQLFADSVSNRQLQVAALAASAWCLWVALRTRTVALASAFTAMVAVLNFTLLTDLGLRTWLEEGEWDLFAVHCLPLLVVGSVLGRLLEVRERSWFALPVYFAAAGLYVAILELLSLNGRALHHLDLTMAPFQDLERVSDPRLLDTVTAMTVNGLLIYLAAWVLERRGTELMQTAARMLVVLSPFALLQPLSYLTAVGEYSLRFDWIYLAFALATTFASQLRQRKSFYYAGLLNTAVALWSITDHNEWWDEPIWGMAVIALGVLSLAIGLGLRVWEWNRMGAGVRE